MVRKPGSKHSEPSSRVTARRNDWNSIRDLHQGPRSLAAFRGRIHDRSPIRCRTTKKPLPRGGRPYMTGYWCPLRLKPKPLRRVLQPLFFILGAEIDLVGRCGALEQIAL